MPVFKTRFGVATGEVIVGNVGSTDRLNYTVLGDTVNLAARLQAINKNYGTQKLVSQSVFEQCSDKFLFKPIDSVLLRGKKVEQIIYELVAHLNPESPFYATREQIEIVKMHTQAFELYREMKLSLALNIFTDLHQKYPEDTITNFYITRIREELSKKT